MAAQVPPLTAQEKKVFEKLRDPRRLQDFLNALPINFEKGGRTLYSPRTVLAKRSAHCFEGALFAAAVLSYHGEKPLLLDLKPYEPDDGHVVALFKRGGYWGALSKTNHATLRFRDPVYKSVRELAMSYFNEYFLIRRGAKTLHSYTPRPFSLAQFGTAWITATEDLWHIDTALERAPHVRFFPRSQEKYIRPADPIERKAQDLVDWDY